MKKEMAALKLRVDGKPGAKLTPDQEKAVLGTAARVWDEIAGDVLRGLEECGMKAIMPRSHVVEVVLDANRLEERLEPKLRKAFLDLGIAKQNKLVSKAFPAARYGW